MRYMGGKLRLANDISFILEDISLNENINDYYEPFCGGCAVAEHMNITNKYCSDANKYLIALLKQAQQGLPDFQEIDEDTWRDVKANITTGKHYNRQIPRLVYSILWFYSKF